MAINPVLFSSERGDWETPKKIFDALDEEFHFTLDAAADANNAKCARYFDKAANGLKQEWSGIVWLNPPYTSKNKIQTFSQNLFIKQWNIAA